MKRLIGLAAWGRQRYLFCMMLGTGQRSRFKHEYRKLWHGISMCNFSSQLTSCLTFYLAARWYLACRLNGTRARQHAMWPPMPCISPRPPLISSPVRAYL